MRRRISLALPPSALRVSLFLFPPLGFDLDHRGTPAHSWTIPARVLSKCLSGPPGTVQGRHGAVRYGTVQHSTVLVFGETEGTLLPGLIGMVGNRPGTSPTSSRCPHEVD